MKKHILRSALLLACCATLCECTGLWGSLDNPPVYRAMMAPAGFTAVADDGQVLLGWNPVSGACGYSVYRSEVSGLKGGMIHSSCDTSYTDTGLANGTTYYYEVTALTSAEESGPSMQVGATPAPSTPGGPAGVVAVAGDGEVLLYWPKVPGAASYDIYRSTTSGNEGSWIGNSAAAKYIDTGLANGTTCYYKVAGRTTDGELGRSNQIAVTPSDLSTTRISLDLSDVTVAVGEARTLLVGVYNCPATSPAIIWTSSDASIAAVNSSGLVQGMAPGRATIIARTGDGCSFATCDVTVTDLAQGGPAGLAAVAGDGQVVLSWNPLSGTTSYSIYRSTASGMQGDMIGSSGTEVYTDKNLSNGTTYYYEITATNGGWESAPSSQVSATPSATSVSGVELNVTRLGLCIGSTATLVATIPPGAAKDQGLSWSSSNSNVATVSSSGLVLGIGKGKATITVATMDGGSSSSCEVLVDTVDSIDGLAGAWLFSGNADDTSVNGNDGIVNGATVVNDRFGNVSSAYYCASHGYIQIPNAATLKFPSQITLSAWIKHSSVTPTKYEDIVMKGNTSYGFQYDMDGQAILFHLTSGGWGCWRNLSAKIPLADEGWHHLVGTYDGSTQCVYIDGVLRNAESWSGPIDQNNDPLTLGYMVAGDNHWLDGCVDDLRVYSRALTLEEIGLLYSENGAK